MIVNRKIFVELGGDSRKPCYVKKQYCRKVWEVLLV